MRISKNSIKKQLDSNHSFDCIVGISCDKILVFPPMTAIIGTLLISIGIVVRFDVRIKSDE